MLRTLERGLVRAEELLLVALLLFMVALSFLQVVLRVGFSTGLLWGDTLLRHLVLWVGFLGAGLAAATRRQFAMDAADRLLRGRAKPLAHLACDAFAAAVCGLLLQASWIFFLEEYGHHRVLFSALGVHVRAWALELILPLGFALLLVHYAIKAALEAETLLRRR